jgi:sRNA-binding regulator protein Hfq
MSSTRLGILAAFATALGAAVPFAMAGPAGATASFVAHPVIISGPVHSAYNGRCLDADLNGIHGNGAKVQLWDCNGQDQQSWTMYPDGKILNAYGRCLDADLNTIRANGTKVQIWDCNGSSQQRWSYQLGGSLVNANSQRCLDADLNTIRNNGTKVQLWDCNSQAQQHWNS